MATLTISEYLQNPYGKGSSFANAGDKMKDLEKEFETLDARFASKLYKRHRDYIFHIVVPSASREDVSYDVVLEFRDTQIPKDVTRLDHIPMRVFSNCPSFIFTYANAFRKYDLLCRWLENKYRPDVKKKVAEVKNQYSIIGLERSLYLSMLYIKKHNLGFIETFDMNAEKVPSLHPITSKIRTQDQIMEKSHQKVDSTEFKTEPDSTKTLPTNSTTPTRNSKSSSMVKSTKKVSSLKPTKSSIKKVQKSKSVKKI